MATKHMNAAPGDFAETVLMPGDPLRAKYIAETWFDSPRRVNIEVEPHKSKEGLVYEFDVFEPNWPEKDEAEDVINDLSRRIVDWVNGFPAGR